MVGNLALKQALPKIQFAEPIQGEIKWCTVSLGEIIKANKRLEASVFDVESKKAYQTIDNCKFESVNLLGENGFVSNAHYGSRLKRNYVESTDETAIGFIGSSEMLATNPMPVKFMSSNGDKTDDLRVKKGTVLISRSGTIGNLTIVNDTLSKLLISEHAMRLECNAYPGYVYSFLKTATGQALINSKIYGSVVPQIEPEHLTGIPVPNPPDKIKAKIDDLVIRSFELRDMSNKLIDRATTLLIEELHFPPIHKFETERFESSCDVNNFTVKLSETSGRVDGSYHIPIVAEITKYLQAYAAEVTTVGDKRVSKAVVLPERFKRYYVGEGQGRVFFGGKQLYELDPSNKKYLSLAQHGDRIKKELEIEENTLLITRSGTVGKVMITPKHWSHWIASDHIIRVVPANKEIAGMLYIFLSSYYGEVLIKRYTYGSVVDEIDDMHVSLMPFPLLKNKAVQDEINALALRANRLRYEAYQAEQEALRIMNDEVIFA